jgi:hypothetical protein
MEKLEGHGRIHGVDRTGRENDGIIKGSRPRLGEPSHRVKRTTTSDGVNTTIQGRPSTGGNPTIYMQTILGYEETQQKLA